MNSRIHCLQTSLQTEPKSRRSWPQNLAPDSTEIVAVWPHLPEASYVFGEPREQGHLAWLAGSQDRVSAAYCQTYKRWLIHTYHVYVPETFRIGVNSTLLCPAVGSATLHFPNWFFPKIALIISSIDYEDRSVRSFSNWSQQPTRSAPRRAWSTAKMAPFSPANDYNRSTTIQPLISKFEKILTP